MYGGSGKLGRGGGGGRTGGNSRKSYPPPSSVRPPGRLGPVGGPMNRLSSINTSKPGSAAVAPPVEEKFSLVPGSNPLAFAMIIKLTPDLVEEIRRVEAQGGSARIKFDANANSTSGNVIDVGGKDFRFTWSREMGGLCDIYEERKSGEACDGLLVETSCAWRKLNVQRVLDESTTSQVKMRSVEAELKHKSRQAIILDHGNPATKNQIKALAAAESNPFKNSYTQKKEPLPKKRKFDSSPGGGPSRLSSRKLVPPSSAIVKSTRSPSPLLSTPNRVRGSVSPYGATKFNKNHASVDDPKHTQSYCKVDKLISENEVVYKTTHGTVENKGKGGATPTDLESKIVSLLTDNPKGMTVKALEAAVGDAFSYASKEIAHIVGLIAAFQPSSGRYILNQGTDSESSKVPLFVIEGRREHNHNQRADVPDHTHHLSSTQEPSFGDKLFSEENRDQEEHLRSNSREDSSAVEKNVIVQDSVMSGHPRSPNKSDGRAGSSSNSGSDSDSDTDSSDSGSDSQSKSKSPVVSGSSSDSDSSATTNSKEGSDVDVDIMSEDDKEQKVKLVTLGQGFSSSPVPWRNPDGRLPQNKVYYNDEDFGTVQVEVEKILPGEDEDIEIDVVSDAVLYNINNKSKVVRDVPSPIHDEHHEHQSYGGTSSNDERSVVKEHDKISSPERSSKGKSKRGFDASNMDQKSDLTKRSKPGNLPPHPKSRSKNMLASESSDHFPPHGLEGGLFMDSTNHLIKMSNRNDDDEIRRPKGSVERHPGLVSNNQPPSMMPVNQKGLENMSNNSSKHKVRDNMGHGSKTSERSSQVNIGFPSQYDKSFGDTLNEDVGIKAMTSGSQYTKPEAIRQYNGSQQFSKTSLGSSPKDDDRYPVPVINGQRSKLLHRELSDLEMGELRESVSEEPLGIDKFVRERTFKNVDRKQGISDNQESDPIEFKPVTMKPTEQRKIPSPTIHSGAPKNPEGSLKKRTTEKTKRPKQRTSELKSQNHLNLDLSAKTAPYKTRHDDRKRHVSQANADNSADLIDVENGALHPEQKRRESSSDENSCSYTKYEKNEPDLRGPIKDVSQYQEYVQEYNSKYDSYISLNKIIESNRNDFIKLAMELESAKGKDEEKYNNVVSRLRESYRQSGEKHKRLKKIFMVLHEELLQLKERMKDFAAAYTKE